MCMCVSQRLSPSKHTRTIQNINMCASALKQDTEEDTCQRGKWLAGASYLLWLTEFVCNTTYTQQAPQMSAYGGMQLNMVCLAHSIATQHRKSMYRSLKFYGNKHLLKPIGKNNATSHICFIISPWSFP